MSEAWGLAALTRSRVHLRGICLKQQSASTIPLYRASTFTSRSYSNQIPSKTFSTKSILKTHPRTFSSMAESVNSSKQSAWSTPGSAAFDFRSDTITTPTSSMLTAIQNSSLFDDVFSEDTTTNDLEAEMAKLTGHEAALFVLSGTMGNQLAIRSHLHQPPHSILCDHRAHILEWESGAAAVLSQALIRGVVPSNNHHLTLTDIKKHVIISKDIHACPTRLITLENTLGGTILPLSELQQISAFARSQNIRIHLDGARLWEAVAAGAASLSEYTELCDSVSLCFSKGLGAPAGSVLVGKKDFIDHARHVRKSIGGGLRQSGVLTSAARVAVEENFGKGVHGEGGKLKGTHELARKIAKTWTTMGGKLEQETETNMVWLDLGDAGIEAGEFAKVGEKHGLRLLGGRLVVHYQIGEEAIERLGRVMDEVLKRRGLEGVVADEGKVGERAYGSYLING